MASAVDCSSAHVEEVREAAGEMRSKPALRIVLPPREFLAPTPGDRRGGLGSYESPISPAAVKCGAAVAAVTGLATTVSPVKSCAFATPGCSVTGSLRRDSLRAREPPSAATALLSPRSAQPRQPGSSLRAALGLAACGASLWGLGGLAADCGDRRRGSGVWRNRRAKTIHHVVIKPECEVAVEEPPLPPVAPSLSKRCCDEEELPPRPARDLSAEPMEDSGELDDDDEDEEEDGVGIADHRVRSLETAWSRRRDAVAMLQGMESPAGGATPVSDVESAAFRESFVPPLTAARLGKIFDQLDANGAGELGLLELEDAIEILDSDYDLGLGTDTAQRLLCYVAGEQAEKASRASFVAGVMDVVGLIKRLRSKGFDLEQLKVVLLAAFKYYDADGNGDLSAEEMAVACKSMNIDLDLEDSQRLLRLWTGCDLGFNHQTFEPPLWEQWQSSLSRAMNQVGKKKGLAEGAQAAGNLLERIRSALEEPGNILEKVQRCMVTTMDSSEELMSALELVVGVQCAGTAAQMLMQAGSDSDLGFSDVASLMIFVGLGAVYTKKDLEEVLPRDMTEKEALLFAQVFKAHGFSQAEFRSLLACPSFSWQELEAGSVLNQTGDNRLKLIVSGRTEVCKPCVDGACSEQSCSPQKLLPYFTVGEERLLNGRRSAWGDDVVRSVEPTILVSWDVEQLREALEHNEGLAAKMHGLMVNSMTRNIYAARKLHAAQGTAAESTNKCCAPFCGCNTEKKCLEDCLRVFSGDVSMAQLKNLLMEEDTITSADVRAWVPHLSDSVRMGSVEQDGERLFDFLDTEGSGFVGPEQCMRRLCTLGQLVASLEGVTLKQLRTAIACTSAADAQDGSSGGAQGLHELLAAVEALGYSLEEAQALALHAYLDDIDEDRSSEDGEAQPVTKKVSDGFLALMEKVKSEGSKKGLASLGFWMSRIAKILDGPGDFGAKARRVQAALWHGMDSLLDGTSCSLDFFSMGVSMWKLSQFWDCPEACEDADVAMLVVSSGLCAVAMARQHLEEEKAPGLSAREALLYAQVFEPEGVAVQEFRQLLKGGNAKWEDLAEGRLSHDRLQNSVRIIASGSCQVAFQCQASTMAIDVGAGGVLGSTRLLFEGRLSNTSDVVVTRPVAALTWQADSLKAVLASEPELKAKVHNIMTRSVTDALLSASIRAAA